VSVINSLPGDTVQLGLQLTDGVGTVFPNASIFNESGGSVPIDVLSLSHVSLGLYSAEWLPPCPGGYFAVYRLFNDMAMTTESDYERSIDTIRVGEWDPPVMGVAYDYQSSTMRIDVSLNRNGRPVPPPTVASAVISVYDADDSVLFTASDVAPDSQGMFRMTKTSPGLVADRLYSVHISITTSCGVVVGRRGFMTTV
jgi:hypothetical protein